MLWQTPAAHEVSLAVALAYKTSLDAASAADGVRHPQNSARCQRRNMSRMTAGNQIRTSRIPASRKVASIPIPISWMHKQLQFP